MINLVIFIDDDITDATKFLFSMMMLMITVL